MTDFPSDDAHLRATETQMRHVLGLHGGAPTRSTTSGSQPQRRRFVRDGEVPVTVIRRDHQPDSEHGANQLDAARQSLRSEAAAREHAERSLTDAQVLIRDLQTKLAHERLAKDEALEAVQRAETDAQAGVQAQETAAAELAAERLARRNAEDALAETLEARQKAEQRLRDIAVQEMRKPSKPSVTRRAAVGPHPQDEATVLTQVDPEFEPPTASSLWTPSQHQRPAIRDCRMVETELEAAITLEGPGSPAATITPCLTDRDCTFRWCAERRPAVVDRGLPCYITVRKSLPCDR